MMRTLAAVLFVVATNGAVQAQTCHVAPETFRVISDLLCGQYAPEPEYRFSGANCAQRSVAARAYGTAAQLALLDACGESDFATDFRRASETAMVVFQVLSVCIDEEINFRDALVHAEAQLLRERGRPDCTPTLRGVIQQRRAWMQEQIRTANDPRTMQTIEQRLNIRIDPDGNITQR